LNAALQAKKGMKENLDIIEKRETREIKLDSYSAVDIESNPVLEKLSSEGCESLYSYLDWLGLANDPDMVILPSSNHFYYSTEDLKNVRTIVNLRQFNRVVKLREHLHTIYNVIPFSCYYLGFFMDSKNKNIFLPDKSTSTQNNEGKVERVFNGIVLRIPILNKLYDLMDTKHSRLMSRRAMTILLEDSGLKVLDMTELNGLTYFCTQKVKTI